MARRRRRRSHRRHHNPVANPRESNPLSSTDWLAVGIGVVGGGLATWLFMNAMLSNSNAAGNALATAASTPTTTNTTGVSTPVAPGSAAGS